MKCASKNCSKSVLNDWDVWCPDCMDAQMREADEVSPLPIEDEGEVPYVDTDVDFPYDYGES